VDGGSTEEDRLHELLSRAEVERLRSILEDREDVVLSLTDENHTILWATRHGSKELFGRDDAAYRGLDASQFVHPSDLADWHRAFARALAGATVRWEGRVLREGGEWVRISNLMWRTHTGGAVIGVTRPADVQPPSS
jgi:transcriptional regulator of aromatic amino acid metabolism